MSTVSFFFFEVNMPFIKIKGPKPPQAADRLHKLGNMPHLQRRQVCDLLSEGMCYVSTVSCPPVMLQGGLWS